MTSLSFGWPISRFKNHIIIYQHYLHFYTINYIILYVFKLYSMRILDIISKNVIFNERVILIKCKFDYTKSKIEDLKKMKIN